MFQRVLLRIIIIAVFLGALVSVIAYARGYRFNLTEQRIVPTGILVASSTPDAAKVYINGKFYGATNSNITLPPGVYDVEIKKEGYTTWTNRLTVKGELVVRTDALLFPQNPSLSPLTSLGLVKAIYFEKSNKVIILADPDEIATGEAPLENGQAQIERAGLYVLDNGHRQISLFSQLKLLAARSIFPKTVDFKNSTLRISPDNRQLLIKLFPPASSVRPTKAYLLSTDQETQTPIDVTRAWTSIENAWDRLDLKKQSQILDTFKDPLPQIASESFKIISFSPDETKILYTPSRKTVLPPIITPALIATNQTEEDRKLELGSVYVYDKKDDRNYFIGTIENILHSESASKKVQKTSSPTTNYYLLTTSLIWHPDSAHLVLNEQNKIAVLDYDGSHKQTVYSGPFEKDFLAVTSDGKLMILANLNSQTNKLPDVYAVGIR
jgi:hypothetical protein